MRAIKIEAKKGTKSTTRTAWEKGDKRASLGWGSAWSRVNRWGKSSATKRNYNGLTERKKPYSLASATWFQSTTRIKTLKDFESMKPFIKCQFYAINIIKKKYDKKKGFKKIKP